MGIEKELEEINQIVARLVITIESKNKTGDFFINSLCEDIFINAFNKIFDCKLENLNYSKPNAAAVDLADKSVDKKVIIQVTSDNKPTKLYNTIAKWVKNIDEYKDFKSLYHFILKKKSSSYKQSLVNKNIGTGTGYSFNINEHIIDIFGLAGLLKKRHGEGLTLQEIIEIKEGLDQSINGLQFKYKALKAVDKSSFSKSNYRFADTEKVLEREVVSFSTNRKLNLHELFEAKSRKYVHLVSNAGFGKSFSLNTYFEYIFGKAVHNTDNLTPFLLNFKDINADSAIETHLIKLFHKRKNPLLIIDGLDEIGDNIEQRRIEENLYSYLSKYPSVRCLLSGRYSFEKINKDEREIIKFEKYELIKLQEIQIKEYLIHKGIYEDMIKDENFYYVKDALSIPFNLYNISEYFRNNKKLERSVLFILHKRINEDLMKHCKKNEMLLLKSRIFLERLSVINNIVDTKLFSKREVGNLIKFDNNLYNVIKKVNILHFDDVNETIRFSNNNKYFEDLLVAYFFKDKEIDTLLKFFQLDGDEVNIPQAWFNSISMLITLHGLNSEISKVLISKFPFILVNAEDFGLPDTQKGQIFQWVFDYYEEKDIWIDNSMYEEIRYVKFGDNEENSRFLLNKIENLNSNFRTKSKAISLLKNFSTNGERAAAIYKSLTWVINLGDYIGDVIPQSFYCMAAYSDFLTTEEKVSFVNLSANSQDNYLKYNQHIRASVYYFITKNNLQENYLDYMLQGLKLLDKHHLVDNFGRSDVTLVDEGYHLDNTFHSIKTKQAILVVLKELYNRFEAYDRYHSFGILEKALKTAKGFIENGKSNKRFINQLISIFFSYEVEGDYAGSWFRWKEVMNNFKIDKFIIETLEAEKAVLHNLIYKQKTFIESFNIVVDVIGDLITENSVSEILEAVDKGIINIQNAAYLCDVGIKDDKILKKLKKELKKRGAHFTPQFTRTTQEENLQFQRHHFDLLFEKNAFRDDILVFFANADEIETSIIDIPNWYKDKFYYSDLRLEFLRNKLNFNQFQKLSKKTVLAFFANQGTQDVLNRLIFEKIKHQNYILTATQHEQLSQWVLVLAQNADFRNAISDVSNNSMKIDPICIRLLEYKKVLDIAFDKRTSLDLLSFDDIHNINANIVDRYEIYFRKIIDEINDLPEVRVRVRENLEQNVKYSSVLGYHIIFSVRYNLTENYKLIEDIIIGLLPEIQTGHFHDNPLSLYYNQTKNFSFLSEHLPQESNDLFWNLMELLINEGNHADFVEEKLIRFFENTDDHNLKLKLADKLILNNSQGALRKFVDTIKKIKEEGITTDFRFHEFTSSINGYRNEEIPASIEMIELTYKHEFDDFENPRNAIMSYYNNLIKSKKENFSIITTAISALIKKNKGKLTNIQFLEMQFPILKNTFYSTYKSNYTFKFAMKVIEDSEV